MLGEGGLAGEGAVTFVVGQRVRVRRYDTLGIATDMGNPHCINGHFGYIDEFSENGYADVRITHGPNGGPVDRRITDANKRDGQDFWPMRTDELEAVD